HRHLQVADDEVGPRRSGCLQPLLTVDGEGDLVTGVPEDETQHAPDDGAVVDDQDFRHAPSGSYSRFLGVKYRSSTACPQGRRWTLRESLAAPRPRCHPALKR